MMWTIDTLLSLQADKLAAEEGRQDVNAAFEREWDAVMAETPDKDTMLRK